MGIKKWTVVNVELVVEYRPSTVKKESQRPKTIEIYNPGTMMLDNRCMMLMPLFFWNKEYICLFFSLDTVTKSS